MSHPSAHPTLGRRAVRVFARLLGVPVGVAFTLALRLSGRKAGVAFMYHSVDHRQGDPGRELVPPHDAGLFESQLRFLVRHYSVVPADRLQDAARARRRGQRFPVAITFDDDLACHESISLPILRKAGVTATFFLSGASLDGPFSFHYERLQRAYDAGTPDLPALVTGVPDAVEPSSLHGLAAVMIEMSPDELDRVAERLLGPAGPDPESSGIRRAAVRALADAGMTVGFHTYRHDALTGLTDAQLADAMQRGRAGLAEAAGAPVDVIGYPGGRADERVADAARAAGFRVGYSTHRVPVTPDSNPLLLGRIGPSLRTVGALALELAYTIVTRESGRPSPAPARAPS
jgi:peptidoglycan/xylan/chitin deacetylase (PgdA/CDA1 family)